MKAPATVRPAARPAPTAAQATAEIPAATEPDGKSRQRLAAELSLSSVVANVSTIHRFATPTFGDMDLAESVTVLSEKTRAVQDGNLAGLEVTLVAQATALDTIFNELARRAAVNLDVSLTAAETCLRLSLKAQAQCRATLQTLAEIKNPQPVAFVKQANIAHGPQQVNNGSSPTRAAVVRARAGNPRNASNELLGTDHDTRLDSGT